MTRRHLMLAAGLGSLLLLLGAWGFQMAGYPPCKLCIWQRWPHGAAAVLGAVGAFYPAAALAVLGGLAALATSGIGLFHAGVERGWWEGPNTCTAGDITGLSTDELMEQILSAPLVRCDDVVWQFAGLSMAGWNAVLSLALAVVWVASLRVSAA